MSAVKAQLPRLPCLPSQVLAEVGSPSSRDSTNSTNQTFAAHAKSGLRNISASQSFTANPGRHVAEQARVSSGALTAVRTFRACSETKADYHRFSRKFDLLAASRAPYRLPTVRIDTMYKKKAQKTTPVNSSVSDGSVPGGQTGWKSLLAPEITAQSWEGLKGKFGEFLTPKFSKLAQGSRLTPERVERMMIGPELWPKERELLMEMFYRREAALSWTFDEIGKVRPEVAPDQEIRTVEHKAWQVPSFPVPRALNQKVIEMLRKRIRNGLLEPCHGPYRNPWFLVGKKEKGEYRLVNAAMKLNGVTIRDANLPPSVEEFAEEFAGMSMASLVDLFSGYDQMGLAKAFRDMTAFMTPLGLLRMTRLPQGATNSVAQFVRVVTKILEDHIAMRCRPFLDDIGVKGPRSRYGDKEAVPGIRLYVLEHIQWLDAVMVDLELAGVTVAGEKSQWCMAGIKIVGFVCDSNGRSPDSAKIIKIVEWPSCNDVSEARSFIGVCVYYRIWVKDFVLVAEPIYRLFKAGEPFCWRQDQQDSMDSLKLALTTAPALRSIDYSALAGAIILAVDSSLTGWGAVLMQIDKETGKRHPSRYESGLWTEQEARYDAGKRECRGLMKALKKVRFWLYGVHFVVEIDANTLVAQLNRSATDLPGALVTRWLAWIRLFDFDVKHMPGRKHTAADGLSRRPRGPSDSEDEAVEGDIDDFIDGQLNCVRVCPVRALDESEPVLDDGYSEESISIATYLTSMQKPPDMDQKQFRKFKLNALHFMVRDKQLFRRANKNMPLRRVIDSDEDRNNIVESLHDESGHRGKEGTYRKVADRYWWPNQWRTCARYVLSCNECQRRRPNREEEALHPTYTSTLWAKVGVDCVHMPTAEGKVGFVSAREDLSGWLEARAVPDFTARTVAKFLFEDVFCRHGCVGRFIMDGGPENKGLTVELLQRYRVKSTIVSAYHPAANGMVERGHQPIVDALSKLTDGASRRWPSHFHAVVWADRTTTKATTNQAPHRIVYGQDAVLPIELDFPTWHILDWESVRSTGDLLALRARQLERRNEDLDEASLRLRRLREENKDLFDSSHQIRLRSLDIGDLVLAHDTKLDNRHDLKLAFKWLGPFRIAEAIPDKGTFMLSEPDGTPIGGTYAGSRLKRWVQREEPTALERKATAEENADTGVNEDNDRTSTASSFPDQPFAVVLPPRPDYEYQDRGWM